MSFEVEIDLEDDELLLSSEAEMAIGRLSWQFRDKPKIRRVMAAMLCWAPELKQVLADISGARNLNTATGASLDLIGKLLVIKRNGMSDDLYRRVLRAQLATLRSKGRHEDIILVAVTLMNDSSARIKITSSGPASIIVEIIGVPVPSDVRPVAETMIRRAVAAGIGALIHQSLLPESDTFTTALVAFLAAPAPPGATSLSVPSAEAFPGSGQLVVDHGLATQEFLTYQTRSAGAFNVPGITYLHPIGSQVSLWSGPGRGLGTITNAAIGGGLSTIG